MGKNQAGIRDGTGSYSRQVGWRKEQGKECPYEDDDDDEED